MRAGVMGSYCAGRSSGVPVCRCEYHGVGVPMYSWECEGVAERR